MRGLVTLPACCLVLCTSMVLPILSGCVSRAEHVAVLRKNDALRTENQKLERTVAQRDEVIAGLKAQIENLKGFPQDRPLDVYSPVSMKIVSLTGGDNYDEKPGDDGVTVYVRLLDADGSSVKSPGQFTVQLLDNTEPESSDVLGVCEYKDEEKLRESWYGRFGTQHFTFKCPFREGTEPPRQVNVNVTFTDYLTGKVLRETAVVDVAQAGS